MSNEIGKRLKKIRQDKGFTQELFGEKLDVSKQAIANIESNHSNPSIPLLCKLIENFNVNINWLLHETGSMYLDSIETSNAYSNFKTELKNELVIEIKEWLKEEIKN